VKRRRAELIVERLERLVADAQPVRTPTSLLRRETASWLDAFDRWTSDFPGAGAFKALLLESGLEKHAASLVALESVLFLAPLVGALVFGFDPWLGAAAAVVLSVAPLVILKAKAESRRSKLSEQLPDAIDLMVAVLRSGHSVPEAVRAVAAEIPNPCGEEFRDVMQRMNLGQSLSEALVSSTRRFRSFELDLMRRAVAIQTEVGGSLADLFESTNATLKGRLKLARQLKTITAQSRLSAYIVGCLPIVLAIALNSLSPGYMQVLFDDQTGRTLFILAVTLECVGLLIMRRMSSVRG
jgi:tight adherence protein B